LSKWFPENLVLKKLLGVIYETITADIEQIDYRWRTERWDESLIEDMKRVFERNVHVNRIQDTEEIRLQQRELNAARTSRSRLYTDAYDLYTKYERLLDNDFEDEDVQSLLTQTLVEPNDVPTLFELFCVFKLVRVLDREYENVRLQPVGKSTEAIARMESPDREIKVFHDNEGSLTFTESIDDVPRPLPEYLRRYEEIIEDHVQTAEETIGRSVNRNLYSGRPDLVVEVYDRTNTPPTLERLLLGEIKYTDNRQTFSDGLKQLLEYIKFARESEASEEYLEQTVEAIEGVLFVDTIDFEQPDKENLSVANTEMLRGETQLPN
jgi:hypothetical protein